MSASTVSITANSAAAARRRPVVAVEKRSNIDFPPNEVLASAAKAESVTAGTARDLIRNEEISDRSSPGRVKTAVNSSATPQRRTRKASAAVKPEKPRWKRVLSISTKNFVALLFLAGVFQVVKMVVLKSKDSSSPTNGRRYGYSEMEGRIAELDGLVKTTAKMMQVQVELLDRKIDTEARGLRQKADDTTLKLLTELKKMKSRNEKVAKSLDDMNMIARNFVSREEVERVFEEFKMIWELKSGDSGVRIDNLRAFARDIVEKEIEKHAGDGLGRVDYALASGGASVVKHSEPYHIGQEGSWFALSKTKVHSKAVKMLTPSFGEPGECFAFKGNNGYVQIKLRTAIIPEAFTLEHVAKSVAYDRSSAPKDCRVYGWLRGQDIGSPLESERLFLLSEFAYDLDKTNAQTFSVMDSSHSGLVDTVRLEFTSNHGSRSHTCIYRFRVHGHEPQSVSVVPKKA